MKPTFLYIGPDKSGSTWLYNILRQHPECYVPSIKDIYFFDRHFDRGMDWYERFFAACPPDVHACGELSHDYLFSPLAAQRIRDTIPTVRLLTTLRDPAARTFSHYLHLVRSGRTRLPFRAALQQFPELVRNSRYAEHLREYLARFPREQIVVTFFEDLVRDPVQFAHQIFESLGLSFVTSIDYHRRVMPASKPRSFVLARLAKTAANQARNLGLERLLGSIKHSRLADMLYRPYAPTERPRLQPEDRAQLVALCHDDVACLEQILDRSLSAWLDASGAGNV